MGGEEKEKEREDVDEKEKWKRKTRPGLLPTLELNARYFFTEEG